MKLILNIFVVRECNLATGGTLAPASSTSCPGPPELISSPSTSTGSKPQWKPPTNHRLDHRLERQLRVVSAQAKPEVKYKHRNRK